MKTIIINHFDISEYTYNMKKYISQLNIKNYDILKLCTEDTFLYLIEKLYIALKENINENIICIMSDNINVSYDKYLNFMEYININKEKIDIICGNKVNNNYHKTFINKMIYYIDNENYINFNFIVLSNQYINILLKYIEENFLSINSVESINIFNKIKYIDIIENEI